MTIFWTILKIFNILAQFLWPSDSQYWYKHDTVTLNFLECTYQHRKQAFLLVLNHAKNWLEMVKKSFYCTVFLTPYLKRHCYLKTVYLLVIIAFLRSFLSLFSIFNYTKVGNNPCIYREKFFRNIASLKN